MNKDHFPLNMKKHDITKEVPTPEEVDKMEEPRMFGLIYKALFYCLSVLLDIRWNTSNAKPKRKDKPQSQKNISNPVIKDTDNIK